MLLLCHSRVTLVSPGRAWASPSGRPGCGSRPVATSGARRSTPAWATPTHDSACAQAGCRCAAPPAANLAPAQCKPPQRLDGHPFKNS
eukprot:4277140-Pyramimonas_sp.AAC.2